ncbi:MAG: type IV pilus assembly protein PilM [Planctomycetota bacterium]|nr:type IV pilus assembly protein PilM [Planctomycetota bacterium]
MPSSNVCWGLEIGAGAIKALKLERDAEGVRVADFAVLPHKKVLSTPDLNKDDAVAVALGAFMSQYRDALKGASVAVSIPGHSAFARFAKLPPVEKKGVANLVRFEAVQQIPFPIEEVEWDYQTFADENSPDIEVGIFAVTKAKISEILAQLAEQGLTPDIITLSPVAVYNAVAYDLSFTAKTPGTVILDIGTTATDLIIADAGRVWIRTFPLGGHNFTEALASTFKMTYGKAERLKREAETSKYKRHIFSAIKPVLAELVQDVQRSLVYYRDTHPDSNITRVIGVGSTFKLIGLRKSLSQQLKLDVYRYERGKRLTLEGAAAADFEAATAQLATAYGLALQGLGLQTINANLMPVQVVRQALWRRKTPWFVAAASLGLVAGGIAFLRPMLDNMAVSRARSDGAITGPIQNATRLGQRLKTSWTEASNAQQPGMVAENMRRLFEGRALHTLLLSDAASVLASANSFAGDPAAGPSPSAELRGYQTEYLTPGSPFPARAADPNAAGNNQAGGDSSSSSPESTEPKAAGEAGAVRITMVFDSPNNSRAFINDSVLRWLRENAQREGVPYTLAQIPTATEITWSPLNPPAGAPGSPSAPGSRAPAPGRGPAPPPPPSQPFGDDPPEDERNPSGPASGSPAPPRPPAGGPGPGSPGGPGGPGGPGRGPGQPGAPADAELEKLAPLPETLRVRPPEQRMYRFTLSWIAQLKTPAQLAAEANKKTEEQEGAASPAASSGPGSSEEARS